MGLLNFFKKENNNEFKLFIFKKLPTGTPVNIWVKPGTNKINIYELGYTSGEGLLSQHKNKTIAQHIINKKAFFAEVVSKNKVLVKLIDKSESDYLQDEYIANSYKNVLEELSKPTRVKEIKARITVFENSNLNIGDLVFPVFFNSLEEHVKIRIQTLKFTNDKNKEIAEKENEPVKIKQVLRAHFNNKAKLNCTIESFRDLGSLLEANILIKLVK